MLNLENILFLVAAYLLGAVPFGLVITRLAGLGDIRAIGSGNIGATNVLRTGRKDLALATLLLDAGKGAIAVLSVGALTTPTVAAAAGAAAFLGHCYPVYLRFKGGKGVATFFGTLAAISPVLALAAGGLWLLTALLLRISSLAALIASAGAPVIAYAIGHTDLLPFVAVMTAVIYLRHRANIIRLLAGEEPRIGKKD